MKTVVSTSITRRTAVAGLTVAAASTAVLSRGGQSERAGKKLYERLGGVFAIAAVVDHFSDAVVKNPIVGEKSKNPQLREWHTKNLGRLPGLKFMRTLWVCDVSGGPFSSRRPSPARRRSALKRHTGTSGSRQQNSMRSQRNSGGPWTSSRYRRERRRSPGSVRRPQRRGHCRLRRGPLGHFRSATR